MKGKVIGCGSAFSKVNYNQCFLLEEDGRKLLIDCGQQIVPFALANAGVDIREIDDIYISHAHADHCGSLEAFAFQRYDWVTLPRPQKAKDFKVGKPVTLYCESQLVRALWKDSLKGGLQSMEGFIATLDTFFDVKPVNANKGFMWQGWLCELIQQIHIVSGNTINYTFGLFMSKEGHETVYFTTDSQHCSPLQVKTFYNKADIIFQDCETIPFLSHVHANYIELAGYPEANNQVLEPEIKAKMWLSHYQDHVSADQKMVVKAGDFPFYTNPDQEEFVGFVPFDWNEQAKKDGFKGFIKVGQEFEV